MLPMIRRKRGVFGGIGLPLQKGIAGPLPTGRSKAASTTGVSAKPRFKTSLPIRKRPRVMAPPKTRQSPLGQGHNGILGGGPQTLGQVYGEG